MKHNETTLSVIREENSSRLNSIQTTWMGDLRPEHAIQLMPEASLQHEKTSKSKTTLRTSSKIVKDHQHPNHHVNKLSKQLTHGSKRRQNSWETHAAKLTSRSDSKRRPDRLSHVKHLIFDAIVWSDISLGCISLLIAALQIRRLKETLQIEPCSLTREIGIVCWRAKRHSLGGSTIGVTEIVRKGLQRVHLLAWTT